MIHRKKLRGRPAEEKDTAICGPYSVDHGLAWAFLDRQLSRLRKQDELFDDVYQVGLLIRDKVARGVEFNWSPRAMPRRYFRGQRCEAWRLIPSLYRAGAANVSDEAMAVRSRRLRRVVRELRIRGFREPEAQVPDFDDSKWEMIDPTTLPAARSTGQVCFCWYRIRITAPPEWKGKKVALYTTVDDYGEVWVDGKLPFQVGQLNGNLVRGHNVPNRVELPDVQPGKTWSIAIFGINGPLSAVPSNWIFLTNTYLEISE